MVSRRFHGFSWFVVGLHVFSRWFHGFWLVSMVFQGSFMFFFIGLHGFSKWFHGFSWFLVLKVLNDRVF